MERQHDANRRRRAAASADRRLSHRRRQRLRQPRGDRACRPINVSGIDNEVRWQASLQGDAPRILNSGLKNVVTRATPANIGTGGNAAPAGKPRSASADTAILTACTAAFHTACSRASVLRFASCRRAGIGRRPSQREAERPDAEPRLRVPVGERQRQHERHHADRCVCSAVCERERKQNHHRAHAEDRDHRSQQRDRVGTGRERQAAVGFRNSGANNTIRRASF